MNLTNFIYSHLNGQTPTFACVAEQASLSQTASTTAEIAEMFLINNVRARLFLYLTLESCRLCEWMMVAMRS
jgi:hypothetical protein